MTMADPAADARTDVPSWPSRAWATPFVAHLAALVVLLAGLAVLTSSGDSFVTDDGSYEVQLRALERGSWTWTSGTERFDPTDTHYPLVYSERTDDGWVPLAKHPAWPWLAHAVAPVTGVRHAYAVLGIVAMVVAAAMAWLVAGDHDRSWSRSAFWLTALAPVVVTVVIGWAHAAAAAAAAIALLGAQRWTRHGGAGWVAVMVGGVAGGILLRTEGVLVAVAVAIAVVVGGRRAGRSWPWSVGWGAVVVAVGVLIVKAEALWIRSITGGISTTFQARTNRDDVTSGFADARFVGAVRSLIDATGAVPRAVLVAALVAAGVTSALVGAGRTRWIALWQVTSVLTVVLLAMRVLARPTYPVTGLLVAWPVAVVGVCAALPILWRRLPVESSVAALFMGAIVATQYADGGAGQWGGRFFAPATVALAVIAAAGIARIVAVHATIDVDAARRARLLVTVLVVLPLVLGVLAVRSARAASSSLFDQIEAHVDGVAITPIRQLPRMMWRHDVGWLVVADDDHGEDLGTLLDSLGSADGPGRVSVVLRDEDLTDADRSVGEADAWTEVDRREVDGITIVVLDR